jgi:hypothetical protein
MWDSRDNLSYQNNRHSIQQRNITFRSSPETQTYSTDHINCSESLEQWGNLSGTAASTICVVYSENASFALSHGPVTIQQTGTLDSKQSYLVKTNLTLINTGLAPIEVTYLIVEFKDDTGDGCLSGERFMCGDVLFGPLDKDQHHWVNPGDSETQTLNFSVVSSKNIEFLLSQKFLLHGVFDVEWKSSEGSISGITGDHREWLVDLNAIFASYNPSFL